MPHSDGGSAAAKTFLDAFQSFTVFHAITVWAAATLTIGACVLGRRWYGTPRERRLRHGWAWFTLASQALTQAYYYSHWRLIDSLPLQLCDLAVIVAALALLTRTRWLRSLLYFWGLGLSTQAFVTPVVADGLLHPHYWMFFVGHLQIVGSAIYELVVLRFRPTRRDFAGSFLITLGYALAMIAFNMALKTNYGYLGDTVPEKPTILDSLPPWPWRAVVIMAMAAGVFVVMWGVWPLARALGLAKPPQQVDPDAPPVP